MSPSRWANPRRTEIPIWYAWAGIGELTPDQVYIRETKIGAIAVLGTEGAPTEGEINAPGITRDTVPGRNHAYEATYDREKIAGETVCTVTNRPAGQCGPDRHQGLAGRAAETAWGNSRQPWRTPPASLWP